MMECSTISLLDYPYVQFPCFIFFWHLRVGHLRYHLPLGNSHYNGTYNAMSFGSSCFQQNTTILIAGLPSDVIKVLLGNGRGAISPPAEDCKSSLLAWQCQASWCNLYHRLLGLTINVWAPVMANISSKLPVIAVGSILELLWINNLFNVTGFTEVDLTQVVSFLLCSHNSYSISSITQLLLHKMVP